MPWLNALWTPFCASVLSVPLRRLLLIPSFGGSVWFVTLAGLLLTWIARGMPRYPGQRNPDVAFISEIAAFELKPFFLIGASITAICFVITIAAVHVVRYEPGFAPIRSPPYAADNGLHTDEDMNGPHEDDDDQEEHEDAPTTKTLQLISLLSILFATVAATSLILFGILDTYRYPHTHEVILRACFTALALQAAGTAVVYANEITGFVSYLWHCGRWEHGWAMRNVGISPLAFVSTLLIIVEVFLGVASISLTMPTAEHYLAAGVLEWIVAFSGSVYLWLFCGFLVRGNFEGYSASEPGSRARRRDCSESVPKNNGIYQSSERAPLLGD